MACFIVPGTEAIVVTAVAKVMEKKAKKEKSAELTEGALAVEEISTLPFYKKVKWLRNLLWGGSALLAYEHVWHGEVVPSFPFLTAAGNSADLAAMLGEMATAGVMMAVLTTTVWGGMLGVARLIEKRTVKELKKAR